MAGLLDWIQTPEGIGLLSAVAGGMSGARRGTPWNNTGRGLVSGLTGYTAAQDQIRQDSENALTKQYRKIQMEQLQQQMERQKAQQTWKAGLPGVMAPKLTGYTDQGRQIAEQQAAFGAEGLGELVGSAQYAQPDAPLNMDYGADKQALQQYLMRPDSPYADKLIEQQYFPKPEEYGTTPFVDSEGNARLIGKTGATKTLPFKGAPKEGASPYGQDLREWFAVNGLDPRTATPEQLQAGYTYVNQVKDSRAPRTTVTVGPTRVENITTQESEGSKVYGKGLGEMQVDIQKQGFTAPTRIANLNRMEQLLDGVDSGRLSGAGLEAARFAKSFGLNVDPKLGNKQAAEALSIEMALAMREPGSGPMTDKDFNNYLNTVPSLAKTAEGRRQITDTIKAKANRDIAISRMAREYSKQNRGVIDDNFLDIVADYMAQNPVVPVDRSGAGAPGGWSIRKK